jgi:hypothetical protein
VYETKLQQHLLKNAQEDELSHHHYISHLFSKMNSPFQFCHLLTQQCLIFMIFFEDDLTWNEADPLLIAFHCSILVCVT